MEAEQKANDEIREYLEKTYRLIYEQMDNKWQYYPKEDGADEVEKRRIQNFGVKDESEIQKLKEI